MEPVTAALVHAATESFTQKSIALYFQEPGRVKIDHAKLHADDLHFVIAGTYPGENSHLFFNNKTKGLFYFFGAEFSGKLIEPNYAPHGEDVRLSIPKGLWNGAPISFIWKWTVDAYGTRNRPEYMQGRVRLGVDESHDPPTRFRVANRWGQGDWEGYPFWGDIYSTDLIKGTTIIEGETRDVFFTRLYPPSWGVEDICKKETNAV
ncbi:hypothetical protein CDD82_1893 [Ophiocordyceps australis]|uniref:Uncharacterized protein n=1 Tax=Ophiocordyceps australis TaxID=1399860 RepID=A0A2C5Y3Z7_9HYPO|nr:hypothetical protein CDD82_1893 [Ophiocordyceps australis]